MMKKLHPITFDIHTDPIDDGLYTFKGTKYVSVLINRGVEKKKSKLTQLTLSILDMRRKVGKVQIP